MAETRQLIAKAFKVEDREFRHSYAESFLNSRIALQIRSNRLARGWTQKRLAKEAGMHQSQIPPLEDIDNEAWTIKTLLKIAEAFDLALIVKLESFGRALEDFSSASPDDLSRPEFDRDPVFLESEQSGQSVAESRTIVSFPGKSLLMPTRQPKSQWQLVQG